MFERYFFAKKAKIKFHIYFPEELKQMGRK
jgi:hypothetical protein